MRVDAIPCARIGDEVIPCPPAGDPRVRGAPDARRQRGAAGRGRHGPGPGSSTHARVCGAIRRSRGRREEGHGPRKRSIDVSEGWLLNDALGEPPERVDVAAGGHRGVHQDTALQVRNETDADLVLFSAHELVRRRLPRPSSWTTFDCCDGGGPGASARAACGIMCRMAPLRASVLDAVEGGGRQAERHAPRRQLRAGVRAGDLVVPLELERCRGVVLDRSTRPRRRSGHVARDARRGRDRPRPHWTGSRHR